MKIGEKIKQLRLEKNMKQSELADKSNLSRVAIGNYERGDRQPTIDTITKIANALEVSTASLIETSNHIELKEFNEFTTFLEFLGYKVSETFTPTQYQSTCEEEPTEDNLIIDGCELTNDEVKDICDKLKKEIDFYLKLKRR